jgi:hypothetical protein
MTAFEFDDELFRLYTKKQIINGFLQKPIKVDVLLAVVYKTNGCNQNHSLTFKN